MAAILRRTRLASQVSQQLRGMASFGSARPGEPTPAISDAHKGPTGVLEVGRPAQRNAREPGKGVAAFQFSSAGLGAALLPIAYGHARSQGRCGPALPGCTSAHPASRCLLASPPRHFTLLASTPCSSRFDLADPPALPDGPRPRQRRPTHPGRSEPAPAGPHVSLCMVATALVLPLCMLLPWDHQPACRCMHEQGWCQRQPRPGMHAITPTPPPTILVLHPAAGTRPS